ncbi:Kinesin-like protein kif3b [Gaertneriomyces sp. JEL0708]|nr:Kinesin-like protein kif3b [Gaertneriomyces sp. JEL0708]
MSEQNVLVTIRCRPFSQRESAEGHKKIVSIDHNRSSIEIWNPKNEKDEKKSFTFDAAFDEDSAQTQVYDKTARGIVDAVLRGFNGTVFCYGQTGTGKTFSMQGLPDPPELRGIIPQAFHHIFEHISHCPETQFLIRISFLEIYNEDIKDLLAPKNPQNPSHGLEIKEHPESGVYVKDLSTHIVKSPKEMLSLMDLGNKSRSVGATLMNAQSSRSHSIFTITIEQSEGDRIKAGKLHLVDLAGSERQSKTGATGDRLKEATKINLSLSALGNCISALVDGKSTHVPYRDSKLTRLLQDSLGGNAKTLMIATLSPASYNFDETVSTLRYANRAKNIKNKPKINEDPKDAMLRQYQEEIAKLKMALEQKLGSGTLSEPKVITKIVKKRVTRKVPRVRKAEVEGMEGQASGDEYGDDEEADIVVEEAGAEGNMGSARTDSQFDLSGLDPSTIATLQAQVESEKNALLASKDIIASEKARISMELEQRALELEAERTMREALASKLKTLETQMIVGGVSVLEQVEKNEKVLEETGEKLREQLKRERELQKELEQRQEVQMMMEEHYASLQEEVDIKTKKLGKLFQKLQSTKAEITNLEDSFRDERADFIDTIRELTRELSLKSAVIENFIPAEERRKIEERALWDEETDEWMLEHVRERNIKKRVEKRSSLGNAVRQPICRYARMLISLGDETTRYRHENIITLKLDLPDRTTLPYPSSANSSARHAQSDPAYQEEDSEILVAELDIPGSAYNSRK